VTYPESKLEEEEAAAKRKAEEEAAAKRKAEEEAAAKRKAEEEAATNGSSGGGGGSGGGGNTATTAVVVTPVESTPVPVVGQRQTVSPVSGTVMVRLKGTSRFVPLSAASSIPDGSEIDATNGRVVITVATPAGTESAEAYAGRFVLHQDHAGSDEVHFVLSLPLTGCPRVALPHGSAAAVASHAKHGPKSRHLWVSEHGGSWGTNGRYVSTTVEGTRWLTQDECNQTEVQVAVGKVKVSDLVRKKTKTLTAGQHYTAKRR
jgi:ferric-dicitrate binding protein FerR (iron transport regulator)